MYKTLFKILIFFIFIVVVIIIFGQLALFRHTFKLHSYVRIFLRKTYVKF